MALPIGARRLTAALRGVESPLIVPALRADIIDYGPPGPHLTGPWAKTKSFVPRLLGFGGPDDDGLDLGRGGCPALEGDAMVLTPNVGAGLTVIATHATPIARPFLVTHMQYWCDVTVPAGGNVQLAVKIADDDDTTGGLATSGVNLSGVRPDQMAEPFNQTQTEYPNRVFAGGRKFIKSIWINNTGVAHDTYLSVSWRYL